MMLEQSCSSKKAVVVRRIRTGDFARLDEILNSAFQREVAIVGFDSGRLISFEKYHRMVELLYRIFDFFQRDYPTILVAVIDDRVVGEVHLVPVRNGIWTLDSLATDPAYTKQGAGYNLIKGALEYITLRNGKKALSSIRTDNVPALRIARKLGFTPYQETIVLYRPVITIPETRPPNDITMRKFQSTDAEKAFQIIETADQAKTQASEMTPENLPTTLLESLVNKALHAHSEKFVAETHNKIVGYAHVTYTSPKEAARIEALCTIHSGDSPAFTESMLIYIFKTLRQKGITKVTITLNVKRQDTIGTLRKLGFSPIASFHEIMRQID